MKFGNPIADVTITGTIPVSGDVNVSNDTPYLANQITAMAFATATVASGATPVRLQALTSAAPVTQNMRIQRVILSYTCDSVHVATLSTAINPPLTVLEFPTVVTSSAVAAPIVIELTPGYFEAVSQASGGHSYWQDWSIALSGAGGTLTVFMLVVYNLL